MRVKKLQVSKVFLFLIISFLGLIIFSQGVYSQITCSSSDQIILRLSSATNAHGEVYNGAGGYPEEICYDTIFGETGNGDRTCTGTNKVLGLSGTTNAHAESPDQTTYTTDVCYGDLSCVARTSNCLTGESLVVSLSSTTNAHLANDNSYPINICCSLDGSTVPPTCSLTSASWSKTQAVQHEQVQLTVEGTNACDGELISFQVWEDEIFPLPSVLMNNNPPENVIFSGTDAIGTWTAEWFDDGIFEGDPEYFFNAFVVSQSSSINSGTSNPEELHVTEFEGSSCGGIVICNDYPNQIECDIDFCGVAEASVPQNIDCGDPDITCECSWDTVDFECDSTWRGTSTPGNGSTSIKIGTCIYDDENTNDNCDDGFLTFSWTATWVWDPSNPGQNDPEGLANQCVAGSKTIECPAQIPLPFFGFYNFIIALAIIALIYVLLISKKEKKRGK